MSRAGKKALFALAALFLLAGAAIFGAGEYLSSPVLRSVGAPPDVLSATPVRIPTAGADISGWFTRGQRSGAILLLHGVRADRRQMSERALWLKRHGYSVLSIDLASHGESNGKRITFGAHEADGVRAALAFLARALPGERIGVIGVSLGGASLLLSAPGNTIHALVLEAVYPTIDEAVENRLTMRLGAAGKWLAPVLLGQIPLRTGIQTSALRPIDKLAQLTCPVMIIGGARDEHTTAGETRRMYAAAPTPKALWLIDGAQHVDFHAHSRAAYEERVGRFLSTHLNN